MPPSPSTAAPCFPPPRFRSNAGSRKKPTAPRTLPRPTSTCDGGGPHPRVLGRPGVRPRGSGAVGSSEVAAVEEREGEKKKTAAPDHAAATPGRRRQLVKRRCPLPGFAYLDDTSQIHPNRRAACWSCNHTAAIFCNSTTGDDLGSNPILAQTSSPSLSPVLDIMVP